MNTSKILVNAVSIVQNIAPSIKKIAKEVPESGLPISRWDDQIPMPWEVFEAKKKMYINKLYETYFDEKGKVIPEIKAFLDETVFNIKTGGGKEQKETISTIKDYLKKSIHEKSNITGELFHGSMNPDKIVSEGFDPKRISRTNLGPGFYFSSEGVAREYGGVVVATIKDSGATCANADDRFYENLVSGDVANKLTDFLGFKKEFCEEGMIQREFLSTIVNQYSRDYIVEDLGVDALCGFGGATPFDYCTCVLNTDIFKSIAKR